MTVQPTATLTLGLRFPLSAAKRLRYICQELRSDRPEGVDIDLFDKAAEATEHGDPLIVFCSDRQEIESMAHGFTRWGVERPAIDELNG